MNTKHYSLTIAVAGCFALLVTSTASAQFSRGPHLGPPNPGGFHITPSLPGPGYLPTTVVRQSTLPLTNPPISPILGRNLFPGNYPNGLYGGFYSYYPAYGYEYGYNQPNITINYNNVLPEPYVPPRNFAVPPPAPSEHPDTARLTLQVPSGAEVFLQGKKVDLTTNTFESPDLAPGESYTFDVRVTWMEKGKQVEQKRTLVMKAGERQSLQYIATPPTAVRLEK